MTPTIFTQQKYPNLELPIKLPIKLKNSEKMLDLAVSSQRNSQDTNTVMGANNHSVINFNQVLDLHAETKQTISELKMCVVIIIVVVLLFLVIHFGKKFFNYMVNRRLQAMVIAPQSIPTVVPTVSQQ